MTNVNKREAKAPPKFHLEIERRGGSCAALIDGVVSICEFSENTVLLVCHGGRIRINGERLTVLTFEKRTVEVTGKIVGAELSYGKN